MFTRIDRAGRLQEVAAILAAEGRTMTTHEVVKKLGLKYSGHSRGLVYSAYQAGLISGWESVKRNGIKVYYWQSNQSYDAAPKKVALPL